MRTNALADAYRKTGRTDDAIQHFQAILAQKSDYLPAYSNLVEALASLQALRKRITKKGIEVAQYFTGQLSAAVQMESWLEQYRLELGRIDGAAAPVTAPSGVK